MTDKSETPKNPERSKHISRRAALRALRKAREERTKYEKVFPAIPMKEFEMPMKEFEMPEKEL